MSEPNWRNSFLILTVLLLVFFGYLVFVDRMGAAAAVLLAAVVTLMAARILDVTKFKFSGTGLEAEMKEVLAEAKATVSQLHLLAEELSKVILWTMQSQGRWGGPGENQGEMRARVISTLDALGISQEKIANILAIEHPFISFDYASYVTAKLDGRAKLTGEAKEKWNEFYSSEKRKGIGYEPSPDELEEFLKSLDLLDDSVKERLNDYRYFVAKKQHRRPDEWLKRHARA